MHKLPFLALLALLVFGLVDRAAAQPRPHRLTKRTFAHNSESSKGKNNKAHFRPKNTRGPLIDFDVKAHRLETFKTARSNKSYKFSKRH